MIERGRLYDQLEAATRVPFVLVSAPAGMGKTTLLSQWLRDRRRQAAWLTLDARDNDHLTFWRYLLTAFMQLHLSVEEEINACLRQLTDARCEAVPIQLMNMLHAQSREVILVLDNYQNITSPTLHTALALLLEHASPMLHIIVSTRNDPPLPLALLRAQQHMIELRSSDLRFTLDESRMFFEQAQLELSESEIVSFHTRTEGWAAALHIASIVVHGRNNGMDKAVNDFQHHILSYLNEEVMLTLSDEVQDFAHRASVLGRLQRALCDALTMQHTGDAFLEWLDRAGFFLVPLDQVGEWYRFGYLFGSALRYNLQYHAPDLAPLLHQRASEWYEQHEMITESIMHAFASFDVERTATLIERAASPLKRAQEHDLLTVWLLALPEETLAGHPALCYLIAYLFATTGQFELYERSLRWLEQGMLHLCDPDLVFLHAELRAFVALLQGKGRAAIEYIQKMLSAVPLHEEASRARAWTMQGIGYFFEGELVLAELFLHQKKFSQQESHLSSVGVCADFCVGDIQAARGNTHEAVRYFQQLIAPCQHEGHMERTEEADGRAIGAHIRLSELYYAWNDLRLATIHWIQALLLDRRIERKDGLSARLALLSARLCAVRNIPHQVFPWLDAAEHLAHGFGHHQTLLASIASYRVQILLRQNDFAAAFYWGSCYPETVDRTAMPVLEQEARVLLQARLALAQHKPQCASLLLVDAVLHAYNQERRQSELTLLLPLSLALHEQGQRERTMQTLKRALSLAETSNNLRIFLDENASLATLITECITRQQKSRRQPTPVVPAYAMRVLEAFDAETQSPFWAVVHKREEIPDGLFNEEEQYIVRQLANGQTKHSIAQQRLLAESTVQAYFDTIYTKLNTYISQQ